MTANELLLKLESTPGRGREAALARDFINTFGDASGAGLFSGPGRTELGGNHTDHQHGHVLCGSVDMDILACAAPNGTNTVRVLSAGYPAIELDLSDLTPKEAQRGTSAALIRGVAEGIKKRGFALRGFDACAVSAVLSGSGLSSSAAYEVLMGNIFNEFYCGGALTPVDIAKIGQYAENVHFGKPCGLMDQMGSSVGGAVAIDFADPANPVVEAIHYDFAASGHALCIIDTASDHADLTGDYAAITGEMGAVAAHFGQKWLRDVPEADFMAAVPALREKCGDRAVLRAMHFYDDDRRAIEEAEALKKGDFEAFLRLVNASGRSSESLLQNIWSVSHPAAQAVNLAIALSRRLLRGRGAVRVHGGGFAGTVQAFVPEELVPAFKSGIEAVFGPGRCHILHIRPVGGCKIDSWLESPDGLSMP